MAGVPGRERERAPKQDGTPRRGSPHRHVPTKPGPVAQALTAAFENPTIAAAIRKFIFDTMTKSIPGLRREFAALRLVVDPSPKVVIDATTATKFRYKDVHCLAGSRVALNLLPTYGNFIHANWTRSELLENQFICTQGPLEGTSGDFWRLVWQERVGQIFMLCRCEELGKNKCFQYWPRNQGDTLTYYNAIVIRNESVSENDGDLVTTLLTVTFNGETRKVEHRQWISWPDKSVPRNPVPAFKLLHVARTQRQPVIVHCSAGIGRTGTLVALEMLQRTLMHGMDPNMPQIVSEIRSQRTQAVQTEDQYVFVHFVMLGKLTYHGLMSQSDYKTFHQDYEEYIKSVGGQPPVQPILPTPKQTLPPAENGNSAPGSPNVSPNVNTPQKRVRRRGGRTARQRRPKNDDEDNGQSAVPVPQIPSSTTGSSNSSNDTSPPVTPQRRHRTPGALAAVGSGRRHDSEQRSERRRRKRTTSPVPQGRKIEEAEQHQNQQHHLVPAQVVGKLAVTPPQPSQPPVQAQPIQYREQPPIQYPQQVAVPVVVAQPMPAIQVQNLQLQSQAPQAPQAPFVPNYNSVAATPTDSDENVPGTPRQSDRQLNRTQSRDEGFGMSSPSAESANIQAAISGGGKKNYSDEDAPKSVFLQPNMARDEKQEYYASPKPTVSAPAIPCQKEDISQYVDAPTKPVEKFYDDDYFLPSKK
uniref:Protein-tyrosine-phosphatase n=1 Tax=Panagrellus redivivus TaxID=6233 RepID=A0A7E4V2K5_PANRE